MNEFASAILNFFACAAWVRLLAAEAAAIGDHRGDKRDRNRDDPASDLHLQPTPFGCVQADAERPESALESAPSTRVDTPRCPQSRVQNATALALDLNCQCLRSG